MSCFVVQCPKGVKGAGRSCKRMSEAFINSCKNALSNLISSETILQSEDPYSAFSSALLNFYQHYCLDKHDSKWCDHEKVSLYVR